jgi:hypothetical protein
VTRKLLAADVAAELGVSSRRVMQLVSEGRLRADLAGVRSPVHVFDAADVAALAGGRASRAIDREGPR